MAGALNALTNQVTWLYSRSKDTSAMIDLIEVLFNQHRSSSLGGHPKTGHRRSLQNRPWGRGQDLTLLYRADGRRGKNFLIWRGAPVILFSPGRRIVATQGCDPSADPGAGMTGAASSRPSIEPFWRESGKSQGFGDRVPK